MKKLWAFGDSYSTPFWYEPDNSGLSYKIRYSKFKGYTPKIATEFIAQELGYEFVWECHVPHDNESIFETIIDVIDKIEEGDMVIVGWAPLHRTRFINWINNCWNIYNITDDNNDMFEKGFLSAKSLEQIAVNKDHRLQKEYLEKLQKLIKFALKKNEVIFWQWDYINRLIVKLEFDGNMSNSIANKFASGMETITEETNGVVEDSHWSENGHEKFASWFIENYKNKTLHNLVEYGYELGKINFKKII